MLHKIRYLAVCGKYWLFSFAACQTGLCCLQAVKLNRHSGYAAHCHQFPCHATFTFDFGLRVTTMPSLLEVIMCTIFGDLPLIHLLNRAETYKLTEPTLPLLLSVGMCKNLRLMRQSFCICTKTDSVAELQILVLRVQKTECGPFPWWDQQGAQDPCYVPPEVTSTNRPLLCTEKKL